jgi:uncharacterized membrane protein
LLLIQLSFFNAGFANFTQRRSNIWGGVSRALFSSFSSKLLLWGALRLHVSLINKTSGSPQTSTASLALGILILSLLHRASAMASSILRKQRMVHS